MTESGVKDNISWKPALVAGFVAFVVVLMLVTAAVAVEANLSGGTDISDDQETDEEPGLFTLMVWSLFGAHFVDIELSAATGFGQLEMTANMVDEWFVEIPSAVVHIIPVVVLMMIGGILAARYAQINDSGTYAMTGASVVVGYLPLVLFSILFFDFSTEIDGFPVAYEIQLLEGLFFAGLLFPILFGGIGGYLAYKLSG